jgi:lysozyme
MAITTNQKVAGGAVGLSAGALALAAVFIPHWESGGHMDTTVRHQSFDPPGVYTVCDGITNLDEDFKWIRPGMTFTVQQCVDGFQKILGSYIVPIAKCIPKYYSMPPHRQVALLSFGYNLGDGTICGDKHHSGAIAREMNVGHIKAACTLMGEYIRANGKVLPGLEHRRFDPKWGEIAWCLKED